MNASDDHPRCFEQTLAQKFIAASGARPTDTITVAGAEHIEILIEFIRRGFVHVLCCAADRGSHVAASPDDILLAPNVKSEIELRGVVARLGRNVRPRGVLVLSCAPAFSVFSEPRLRRLLMDSGFTAVERMESRGDAGTVWRARKEPASMRRAA